jgi:tRNA(Ile)-lysidine synthase TilS/MesJ
MIAPGRQVHHRGVCWSADICSNGRYARERARKELREGKKKEKGPQIKAGVRRKFNLHICSTQYLAKGTDCLGVWWTIFGFLLKFCFPSGVDKGVSR